MKLHQLYQLKSSRLLVEHPPATEETPLAPERAALETLASEMVMFETSEAKPTPFEQTLEAQGDMLAELNVLMARFQGNTQSEYYDFVTALTGLKTAHDTHHITPELVLRARESYRRLEKPETTASTHPPRQTKTDYSKPSHSVTCVARAANVATPRRQHQARPRGLSEAP